MRIYESDRIRNIAILGHSGAGKSNMIEAFEFTADLRNRIADPSEDAKMTNSLSLHTVEYRTLKYNFLDVPGYFDFSGELESGLVAADGAIILVDGTTDLAVGTENALDLTEERNMPRFIFVNKIDSDKADYEKILAQLREKYPKRIAPFHVPWGKAEHFKGHINVVDMYAREFDGKQCNDAPIPDGMEDEIAEVRDILLESVAETSEELMDKYFNGEEFTTEEMHQGLRQGVLEGDIIPVICGSTQKNIGLHTALDMIRAFLPEPRDNEKVDMKSPDFKGQVFKTTIDSFVGRISYVKVLSGELKPDSEVFNVNKGTKEKIGKINTEIMDDLVEIPKGVAGDIIVLTKLSDTLSSDTLSSNKDAEPCEPIAFPKEQMLVAIAPVNKADEDKISSGLQRLMEEDGSFTWRRDKETGQTVLGVQGDIHVNALKDKLKDKFGVDVLVQDLKVPYRETIKGTSDVQGKYKKQSGGHGQYGDVKVRFAPSEELFEFTEEIFGGSVPKSYIPAVEKGLQEAMEKGILAGYPTIHVKATLYDGSYHDVDSSEMAFKMAASLAFKKGMEEAKPVLLEPVMAMEIYVPDEYMGDVIGDISKRRGRVLGMQSYKTGKQQVSAEAPVAETTKYANDLKAMTQGRGFFEMSLARYEEVPGDLAKKIVEAHQAD